MGRKNEEIQINFVARNELDTVKYDACIFDAQNSLIYGFSWYLDVVCEEWGCLVLNNYEAVLPLPLHKKFGITYVFLPPWVQQLGIFYRNSITHKIFQIFVKQLTGHFLFVDVFFNAQNKFILEDSIQRKNFIKFINKDEYFIRSYSKGRKSAVNQGAKNGLNCTKMEECKDLIELHQKYYHKDQLRSELDLRKLRKLVEVLKKKQMVDQWGVFDENSHLLGGAIFIKHQNRVTYLFSVQSVEGREKQALSFLIDFALHFYSRQFEIFDFEGSMNQNIATFFKSFGVEEEIYFHYQSSLTRLFQKIVNAKHRK
ncbi:hypothetical protein [Namhaeicola litoreus]|uniref:GNAT family N-acetyltransferase n=1 Tax=Namhaeicola litoreus TaxID=1052145 RepID=A0ABW3Y4F8_9FLAO